MSRRAYPTDLTDAEWRVLDPHLLAASAVGRPRVPSYREILGAIFCVVRSVGALGLVPHDLPPWQTVYHSFRQWRLTGLWLGNYRRLSKDYERLCATSEALIYAATSRLMARRLARA